MNVVPYYIQDKPNLKHLDILVIVCKPYDEKRAYACFRKIMSEYNGIIASKYIGCKEYYEQNKLIDKDEWVHFLVGDIQRMKLFE